MFIHGDSRMPALGGVHGTFVPRVPHLCAFCAQRWDSTTVCDIGVSTPLPHVGFMDLRPKIKIGSELEFVVVDLPSHVAERLA